MGLGEEFSKLKFDRRMLEINKNLGLLTDDEYKKFVDSLEDVESNATKLEIDQKKSSSSSSQSAQQTVQPQPAPTPEPAQQGFGGRPQSDFGQTPQQPATGPTQPNGGWNPNGSGEGSGY